MKDGIDNQLIFEVTCWKCWTELTGIDYKKAKFPFKVDIHHLKANRVFDEFCRVNFIKLIQFDKGGDIRMDKYPTYKCPMCGYDRWRLQRYYYPYLYLWVKELLEELYVKIIKGKRSKGCLCLNCLQEFINVINE